jgi:hypothetical protein
MHSVASFLVSTSVIVLLAAATAAGDRGYRRGAGAAGEDDIEPGHRVAVAVHAVRLGVAARAIRRRRERYAELANAGLNATVLPQNDPGTEAINLERLDCARPVGVRNLLLDMRLDQVHENDPSTYPRLDSIVGAYKDDRHSSATTWRRAEARDIPAARRVVPAAARRTTRRTRGGTTCSDGRSLRDPRRVDRLPACVREPGPARGAEHRSLRPPRDA